LEKTPEKKVEEKKNIVDRNEKKTKYQVELKMNVTKVEASKWYTEIK